MEEKLKIAVFHNLSSGGALRVLHDHIVFLKNEGHIVDVFVPETAKVEFSPIKPIVDNYYEFPVKKSFFRNLFVKIINFLPVNIQIEENSRFSVSFNQIKYTQKKIAESINEKDYDIVFSEQDGLFTFSPAFLKYIKKPTVYYCQQPMTSEKIIDDLNFKTNSSLSNPLMKKIFYYTKKKWMNLDIEYAQYAKHILANSYFSHEKILGRYGKNSQVSYLGIDTDIFQPSNSSRKNYVLSAGAIIPDKGYDFIIKSIAEIDEKIRPSLYIVGYSASEPLLNYLQNLAQEKNVDFQVFSNVSDEKISELYNQAKLFIFAPYLNPFGLVFLEAMACGTPAVCVKEGGVREVINNGENGLLVPRDEKLFAEAITDLLINSKQWEYLSKNSIKSVNDYWTTTYAGQRLLNHMYRIIEEEKEE